MILLSLKSWSTQTESTTRTTAGRLKPEPNIGVFYGEEMIKSAVTELWAAFEPQQTEGRPLFRSPTSDGAPSQQTRTLQVNLIHRPLTSMNIDLGWKPAGITGRLTGWNPGGPPAAPGHKDKLISRSLTRLVYVSALKRWSLNKNAAGLHLWVGRDHSQV